MRNLVAFAVSLALLPAAASAQTVDAPQLAEAPAQFLPVPVERSTPSRLFFDLNWTSYHPRTAEQQYTLTGTRFGQPAMAMAMYREQPSVRGWDLTGAVGISGGGAVGARVLRATFTDVVGIGVAMPHPTIQDNYAIAADLTSPLRRDDWIVDLYVLHAFNKPRWRLAIFGGPTYFHLRQDMVEDVEFFQTWIFAFNFAEVTGFRQERVRASAMGINGGADLSFFFSRYIGVGGGLRMNYGNASITEPLSEKAEDVRLGSTSFVVGPRFRF